VKIFLLIFVGFQAIAGIGQEPQRQPNTEELNPALIMERIAKASPEGLAAIERAKRLMPEIHSHRSARTLGGTVEACISGRGQFILYRVGWEALKGDGPRWSIFFYFKDEEQKYVKAAWGYDEGRNVLLPMEFIHATKFWVRRSENKRPWAS
jgi:hypothetical protein